MKIRILKDKRNVYKKGEEISIYKLLADYKSTHDDDGWIERIPIANAVDIMCEEMGIEYEYV